MPTTIQAIDETNVACAQVRGGNGRIETAIELPGLAGALVSSPSDGGGGGDVYFLSVCGSGLLTRICLADLVGHGASVAGLAQRMHSLLQRFINRPDHRRILRELNRSLVPIGLDAMTTAAVLTYYPPTRALSYSYAGHPPGWYFRKRDRAWKRLETRAVPEASESELVNGVLGVTNSVEFTRSRLTAEPGDRLVLVTDGVLETPGPDRGHFGAEQLEALLDQHVDDTPAAIATNVIDALTAYRQRPDLDHDDVTILVLEVVDGPRGPALWHVLRNRVLRRLGLAEDPTSVAADANARIP